MDVPQLDFREALSTPEEKLVSSAAVAAHLPLAAVTKSVADDFLRGVRLSRSTLTNIVFVAIASVGGLVCAFYFFNGAEVLRAAASWPSEYLYPRPISTDKLDGTLQPNPVDQYSAASSNGGTSTSAASKNIDAQNNAFDQPFLTTNVTNVTPPTTTSIPPTDPGPVPPPIVIVPPPIPPPVPPPTSLLDRITNDLNSISPGSGTTVKSLYQTVASTGPASTAIRTTKNSVKTTRRKVSATKQRVVTTATSTTSTARNLQQTVGQTQMTQMNMNTVNTAQPVNQTMSSGGMGGISGLGGGIGGTAGAGAGAGAGTVGGTVGGLGGGLNGGGLGGTISGIGGTVGGVLPHH
jgi:hypothetical protein